MILKALAVFALLAMACAEEDNIDEFIKEVFESPVTSQPNLSASPDSDQSNDAGPCNQKIAKCVHYYLCDYQYQSDDKKISALIQETADSYCPSYLDTCCIFEAIYSHRVK